MKSITIHGEEVPVEMIKHVSEVKHIVEDNQYYLVFSIYVMKADKSWEECPIFYEYNENAIDKITKHRESIVKAVF